MIEPLPKLTGDHCTQNSETVEATLFKVGLQMYYKKLHTATD